MTDSRKRVGAAASLRAAAGSWRIGAVVLQSFSSGLPLGLVWIALPAWLKYRGVDIKTIGLFTLAQAPWTLKFLWAPLMDRYRLPFLGRKRSWMLLFQILLIAGLLGLAREAESPTVPVVAALAIFIAFSSASQDIAIDGYAVEVLEKNELGVAVGGRVALYRVAMLTAGAVAITIGQKFGWPAVFIGLALLYVPLAGVVVASPEPPARIQPPPTLRAAVFDPFVSLFRKPRAPEIIAFILLYKLGDNMATALIRPFLIEKCFSPADVGLATATIGLICIIAGTIFGAALTRRIGIGRALWIFGMLQAVACVGYIAVDRIGAAGLGACAGPASGGAQPFSHRILMYAATALETGCQGMATGALDVFLIRLTQKRFSATQYALFASIFALGRTLAGAPAGILVDAIGWTPFFVATIAASVPGLVMLARFVPPSVREPDFEIEEVHPRGPISAGALAAVAGGIAIVGVGTAVVAAALLDALKAMRGAHPRPFDLPGSLARLLSPATPAGWLAVAEPVILGIFCGLGAAGLLAARRGIRRG
ncbi:MAG TPA: MFS transporter [Thermoanaerobaculia bacterium]|nr:MFS transporter [Thermoanaerobaculia bacterium]